MSNLVNLVKALLGSMLDVCSFKAKKKVFEFDHQKMNTFEFIRKNDVQVCSMLDKMVFDPSLDFRCLDIKNCIFFHHECFQDYRHNVDDFLSEYR